MNAKAKDVAYNSLYGDDGMSDEYFNMTRYMEDAARTVSDEFHTDLVPSQVLLNAITETRVVNRHIDNIKKALFYGRADDDIVFEAHITGPSNYGSVDPKLVHAILGIYTEAVELLELLQIALNDKDRLDQPFDPNKLINESGDSLWYLALLFRELGTDFEEVGGLNIAKLKKRFPVKFTEDLAVNRDEAQENVVFE